MTNVVTLPLTGAAASGTTWRSSWKEALDAVELDINDVENLLDRLHADADARVEAAAALLERTRTFTVIDPALGALPKDQVSRARALLGRQVAAASYLARAMSTNRRHARAAAAMTSREDAVPVYIDAEA